MDSLESDMDLLEPDMDSPEPDMDSPEPDMDSPEPDMDSNSHNFIATVEGTVIEFLVFSSASKYASK